MEKKMKLTEQKTGSSLDRPRFVLTLGQAKSRDLQTSANYDALAKLIGASDFMLSLDSSLLNLPYPQREPYIEGFLRTIRALNLEYRYKNFEPQSKRSIFSMLLGNANKKEHEILAFVPNETWVKGYLKDEFPVHGARYFVLKENTDSSELFEDMEKMLDSEKLEYFKMIIFHSVTINSMGICTKHLALSDLKEMLGI
jgi:hypothetical protein